jgi:hypothetical protein
MIRTSMTPHKLVSPSRTINSTPTHLPPPRKSLYSRFGSLVALAAFGLLLAGQYQAGAWLPLYSDDFDDGNDTLPAPAWNHWDPINAGIAYYHAVAGLPLTASPGPNTYTFPGGNTYELSAPAFPYAEGFSGDYAAWSALTPLGPARNMAYRSDNYTNFNVTVDILPGWAGNNTYVQEMGLAARMQGFTTPGQAKGYAFVYVNAELIAEISPDPDYKTDFLAIYRFDTDFTGTHGVPGSGNAAGAGDCEYHFPTGQGLDPAKTYRMQFIGKGTHLEGRIYDVAVSTNVPIVVLDGDTAGDGTRYTNGPCGFFAMNLVSPSYNFFGGPVDVTIDNYTASIHSPYEIRCDFNNASDGQQNYPDWSAPGWYQYDPRSVLGINAAYSFPNLGGGNYGYKISAPPSPAGEVCDTYGPARAGSLRTEVMYSDFYVATDVRDWNPVQMVFGLAARGRNPGIGSTDAYIWTYEGDGQNPITWPFWISKLTGEVGSGVDSCEYIYELPQGGTYRMSFKGQGTQLTGRVSNLGTHSDIVVTGSDSTYTEGFLGLFVAASQSYNNPCSINPYVTFDNFYSDINEPRLQFSEDGASHAVLKWPGNMASIWVLQKSSAVDPGATWTEIPPSDGTTVHYYYNPTTGLNTCTNTATVSSGTTFFRLLRCDPVAYP